MGYKPDVVQKAKVEYSHLGQVFNKGLEKDEKQKGLLKRLENIEDKTDNQLDLIRDQGDKQLDLIKDQSNKQLNLIGKISSEKINPIEFYDKKNKEAVDLAKKVNNAVKKILKSKDKDDKEPRFIYYRSDGTPDSFDRYINLKEFGNEIADRKISLNEAIKQQAKMLSKIESLENHNVKVENNKIFEKEILKNVRIVYNARLDIIEGFEKEFFF